MLKLIEVQNYEAVSYASTANVAGTYNNGTSGVGATLTGTGSLVIDGYTVVAGDAGTNVSISNSTGLRVLLKDQTLTDQNGIYAVTACVSGTSWTLTRAYDYDVLGEVAAGDFTYVLNGATNGKFTFVEISKPTAISGVGTGANAISFSVFANGNISGTVNVNQGGTGVNTLSGVAYGNGTSAFTAATGAQIATAIGSSAVTKATNIAGGVLGSVHYQSAADTTALLAPNTTTTKKFLRQTGDGTNSAAPAWDTVLGSDITTPPSATTGVNVSLIAGPSSSTTGVAGDLALTGGAVPGTGAGFGGNITITGGAASTQAGTGGSVTIYGGRGTSGQLGNITIGSTTTTQAVTIAANSAVYLPSIGGTAGFVRVAATTGAVSSSTIAYSDLPTNVGVVARKVSLVGTGTGQTIALTHGLGTNLVTAQVYDTSTSTATLVEVDITVTSTVATATFASASTTLSNYTLVVIG